MAIWSLEGKFPTILGFDLDVVVPVLNVKSSEDCFAMQLFQDEVDPGHGVHISLHPLVHILVVLYEVKTPILLVDKEDRATPG